MVRRLGLVLPFVAVLLVGCPAPVPDSSSRVEGTVVFPGGVPVLGIGMVISDTTVAPTGLTASALTELGGGIYATPTQPVAANGAFQLRLPGVEGLTYEVFRRADEFLYNVDGVADCSLVADPLGVDVTGHVFDEKGSYPGFYGVHANGLALSVVTETPVDVNDLAAYPGRFLAWVFARSPVAVATVGSGCLPKLDVELELERGWNVLGWTYDVATNGFTVRSVDDLGDVIVTLLPTPTP